MLKKLMVGFITLVIIAVVVVALSLNFIAKDLIQKVGSQVLGTEVTLDSVTIALLEGGVSINGLTVANPEGYKGDYALQVSEISVQVPLKNLLQDTIVIDNITIDSPQIHYHMGLGGSNIGQLVKNVQQGVATNTDATAQTTAKADTDSDDASVIVKELVIQQAKVTGSIAVLKAGVTVPEIRLQNLGQKDGGVSLPYIVSKVMMAIASSLGNAGIDVINGAVKGVISGTGEVVSGSVGVVKSGAGTVGKGAESVVKGAGSAVGGAVDAVKGLFD